MNKSRWLALFALMPVLVSGCTEPDPYAYFDSNGVSIRYVDRGEGEPVILIHGFTNSLDRGWVERSIVEALVTAGYRVIAYDNRGHGGSDKPHEAGSYGMNMVEDLGRLLDRLEVERAHIVGYSMGSAIANKFVERYPARVDSLVLAGYGNLVLPSEYSEQLETEIEAALRERAILDGNDAKALTMLCTQWTEWNVAPNVLAGNTIPALALIGADDPFLPQTEKLVSQMAGIDLRVVPGDHSTAPDTLEFLEELLTFLSSQKS